MKLAKQPPDPSRLAEFFEQALGELGAVCERAWHDRLDVVAEGEAASLWRNDGQLHAATLHFPEPAGPGARGPRSGLGVGTATRKNGLAAVDHTGSLA